MFDKIMNVRTKIMNNILVKGLFRYINYTEDGRGLIGRFFFGVIAEFMMITMWLQVVMDIRLSIINLFLIFVVSFQTFFLIGYSYRKFGFKRADKESAIKLDPIGRVSYDASRIIISEFGSKYNRKPLMSKVKKEESDNG